MLRSDWDALAIAWLAELRTSEGPGPLNGRVVEMQFSAQPEDQFSFIWSAVLAAQSDRELAAIAAGPVENLLAVHGPAFIERFEAWAALNPTVARMLTAAWRSAMTDDVWARVQAIRRTATLPLETVRLGP